MQDQDQDWAAVIRAPFGKLGIKTALFEDSLMLKEIFYVSKDTDLLSPKNALAKNAREQIEAYFKNPATHFDLPMIPQGTNFQQKVWQNISVIPLGKAMTYGELARKMKSGPRAIGGACGANPFPLLVPCHRVVSATGIGGFARQDEEGYHRNIKTWLLQHEGVM
jgi:methylated-DNA-[protein]-cysteine S-methyltransferase